MSISDRIVEWMMDNFVHQIYKNYKTRERALLRIYPFFPSETICINVLYVQHMDKDNKINVPHNHHWSFFSLQLYGGYVETLFEPDGTVISQRTKRPGMFSFRNYKQFHDFYTIKDKAITLFIRSKLKQKMVQLIDEGKPMNDLRYYKKHGWDKKKLYDGLKYYPPRNNKWFEPVPERYKHEIKKKND